MLLIHCFLSVIVTYSLFLFSGTDLKDKITSPSRSMYRSFREHHMPLIYDPDKFRKFSISAGAPSIFDNVLASVTTPQKSTK